MNVRELKNILSDIPDDLTVCTDGYESGVSESVVARCLAICRNGNGQEDGIYGRHTTPCQHYDVKADDEVFFIGEGRWFNDDSTCA